VKAIQHRVAVDLRPTKERRFPSYICAGADERREAA
jgi:hypothetical protein